MQKSRDLVVERAAKQVACVHKQEEHMMSMVKDIVEVRIATALVRGEKNEGKIFWRNGERREKRRRENGERGEKWRDFFERQHFISLFLAFNDPLWVGDRVSEW